MGPGATYKNKYPPVANYTPAGQVWVEAEYFNKGWVPDQATLWSQGFNNGAPAVASLALDAADTATDNYLALLSWQAEQYPDSIAAEIVNAPEAYAAPTGKTVYVGTLYTPSNAAWQRFVVLNYTLLCLAATVRFPALKPVANRWTNRGAPAMSAANPGFFLHSQYGQNSAGHIGESGRRGHSDCADP